MVHSLMMLHAQIVMLVAKLAKKLDLAHLAKLDS
jgi:hypothetical protein